MKPQSFLDCCRALEEGGMDPDKACRAAEIAFWKAHGMTPDAAEKYGLDPAGDLTSSAWMSSIELSNMPGVVKLANLPDFHVGQEFQVEKLLDLGELKTIKLDAFGWEPQPDPKKRRRLFSEVRFLKPGKWAGFDFTDANLRNFNNNFQTLNNPPIILDHEWTIKNLNGYIRALRYEEGYTENDSLLWALWEFLGDYACTQVEDGLWKRVSGGWLVPPSPADQRLLEGSVVLLGAYDNGPFDRAQILGGNPFMSVPKTGTNPATTPAAPAPATAADPAAGAVGTGQPPAPAVTPEPAPAPAAAPAAPAAAPTTDPILLAALTNLTNTVTSLAGSVKELQDERKERQKTDRERDDERAHEDLVHLGKSIPALKDKDLKVLSALNGEARNAYLELRRELPNVYPTSGRRSYPSHTEPPGKSQDEDDDLVALAAEMGQPITTKADPTKEGK